MSERIEKQLRRSMYQLLDLFYDEIIKYSKDKKTKQMFHKLIKTNLSCSKNEEFFEFNREDFSELNGHVVGIPFDERNMKIDRIPGIKLFILYNALEALMFIHEGGPYKYHADQAFSYAIEEFGKEVVFNIANWAILNGDFCKSCGRPNFNRDRGNE